MQACMEVAIEAEYPDAVITTTLLARSSLNSHQGAVQAPAGWQCLLATYHASVSIRNGLC